MILPHTSQLFGEYVLFFETSNYKTWCPKREVTPAGVQDSKHTHLYLSRNEILIETKQEKTGFLLTVTRYHSKISMATVLATPYTP